MRPHRALELHDAETENVFREAPFPLFALDDAWEGNRCLGGFATSNGQVSELRLGHIRETPDGRVKVVVGVQTPHLPGGRDSDGDVALRFAALHLSMQLVRETPASPPEQHQPRWPDLDTWSPVTFSVDGAPVEFRSLMNDERWVAVGHAGQVIITVEARRFDVDLVSLKTVHDLEPYIVGTRARRKQMRQTHDDR